jgi:hypothetical protein
MGIELALILGAMGTVWTGNPLSLNPGFSIGGPANGPDNILGNVLGLLGIWYLSNYLSEHYAHVSQVILAAFKVRTTGLNPILRSRAMTSTSLAIHGP